MWILVTASAFSSCLGKGLDLLSFTELEEPLLELVLGPGEVLYVPAGFPHATDTVFPPGSPASLSSQASLHLTVGVDCLIWGLTYAGLRSMLLQRAGLISKDNDKLVPNRLEPTMFWRLHSALPLGFLAQGQGGDRREPQIEVVERVLLALLFELEPQRAEQGLEPFVRETVQRVLTHHEEVTAVFSALYEDVAMQRSPATMNLNFFRSQPYFQKLEAVMTALQTWASEGVKPVDAAKRKGADKSVRKGLEKEREDGKARQAAGFGRR